MANGLTNGQGLEGNLTGKLVTKTLGEEACKFFWVKDEKIFVSHRNAHQKVTLAEEDLKTHMDKMTCSVESSQHFSSVTQVIAQWAHEQSGHGRMMQVIHRISNMDSHSCSWYVSICRAN